MTRPLTAVVLTFLGLAMLVAAPLTGAKHEIWFEVRSPNFIVVCNAGEKEARKTAVRFEQIRAVFRRSLEFASKHQSPVITILAVKDENSVKALLPEDWAKGHAHPAGLFVQRMNQYFAVVQLDAPGSNPYNTIYHEYYHSLTMPYFPNLPVWLSEGLAEFWGNSKMSDSEVGMGEADPDLIAELKEGGLLPLDVVFQVDHNSPYYNEQNKISVFYAESWALTHYLMVGDKAAHRPMLQAYLHALAMGESQEQAAAESFGDLKKLQTAVYSYIRIGAFYYLKSPPPPEIASGDLHVRELSEAEMDAYRGGFAAVRGQTKDAKPLLEEAVKLDPKLALGYQYLGLAEYEDRQRAEALADFTRAIDLDPKNALTRYLRAYLASTQRGAVADDAQLEEDLRTAIAVSPEFAPPYGALAVHLANRGESLPEALQLAQKAQTLEPGNTVFQIDLAQVLARMNRYDDARTIAIHARANATNPIERAGAEQFLAFLEQIRNFSPDDSDASKPAGLRQSSSTPSAVPDAAGSRSDPPEVPRAQENSGSLREATGKVMKLSCSGGLKFELKSGEATLTLHIRAGANLRIQMTTRPAGPFNPCSALQGQRVKVSYQPDDARGKTGTLDSLTILSGTSDEPSGAPGAADGRRLGVGSQHRDPVAKSAEGNVKEVVCNGKELTLQLDAEDGLYTLHARDATRVEFEQDVAFDTGDFQPCTQLQGRQAKIAFMEVDGTSYDGEIQGVEVEK